MKYAFLCLVIGLFASLANDVQTYSQDSNTFADKYFDSTCFGYVHFNLDKLDIDSLSEKLQNLVGQQSLLGSTIKSMTAPYKELQNKLKSSGVVDVYFVFVVNENNFDDSFGFVPTENAQQSKLVQAVFSQSEKVQNSSTELIADGVLLGNPKSLRNIKSNGFQGRNDAAAVLLLHENQPASIVISPSPDQTKIIRELTPAFGDPWRNFTGESIADGVQSLVAHVNSGDELQTDWTITSKDSQSSMALATELQSTIALFAKKEIPQPDWAAAPVAQICSSLKLKQQGTQITTTMNSGDASFDALAKSLQPAVALYEKQQEVILQLHYVRTILIACHNYHDANKSLPPYASFDDEGKPLLSWRVHILQFTDQSKLYDEFKLDEPWDSPHNIKLVSKIPDIYLTNKELAKEGKTSRLMPFGDGFIGGKEPLRLRDVRDGTSRTIMVADVSDSLSIPWSKPGDWEIDLSNALIELRVDESGKSIFGLADGTSHHLELDADTLKAFLTTDRGERVELR